jgi:glucose/arabinose dehydrogenase
VIIIAIGSAVYSFAQNRDVPPTKQEKIPDGAELYAINCASCHGADLNGGAAKSLIAGQLEFVSSRGSMNKLIRDGDIAMGMPGFGDSLSKAGLDALTSYVMTQSVPANVKPATDAEQVSVEDVNIDLWVDGLNEPWALAFISASHALVTEKDGELHQIRNGVLDPDPVGGIPEVWSGGQGGLLDVAIDPEYAENNWIYLSFSHPVKRGSDKAMTKLIRGHIVDNEWRDEQVLFAAKPEHYVKGRTHFGSRITFDDEGYLYFSIGERGKKEMAQDISRPNGKIHRTHRDGSIPAKNPFVSNSNAYPSIFAYGNRNPQGLVYVDGNLWETEHGPKGGDELNRIEAGANYGWPVISYGRNYNGTELTPFTHKEGMEQPVSQWSPSIAACGLDVYAGSLFNDWNGDLLAGALRYEEVRLIDLENGEYQGERILLKDRGRVRDVTTGPDGAIYVVLNSPDQILRLSPSEQKSGIVE